MTANGSWTPPARPGIIPLHPLGFGTVLGRSFTALRQNPRVLLGFALGAQAIGGIAVVVALGGLGLAVFGRLDRVQQGSADYQAVMAGSIALFAIAAFVLGLATAVLGVLVQAVVVTEVAYEVVAERLTLRDVWRRVKPVAWRLLGYTALLGAAVVAVAVVVGTAVVLASLATPAAGVVLMLLVFVAMIPLYLWLATKLLLVPSAIILERVTISAGIRRSWLLTRGRFWPILGIVLVISIIFSTLAQLVSTPFSLLAGLLGSVFAPTGNSDTTGVVALIVGAVLTQLVVVLVSAVGQVVQSTATAILYTDCRMRHEGLDLDLLAYVEQRDAGAAGLADPFTVHPGRTAPPRQPTWAAPAGYAAYPPPTPGGFPPPGYPAAPTALPSPVAPPSPTTWAAPGAVADEGPPRP